MFFNFFGTNFEVMCRLLLLFLDGILFSSGLLFGVSSCDDEQGLMGGKSF